MTPLSACLLLLVTVSSTMAASQVAILQCLKEGQMYTMRLRVLLKSDNLVLMYGVDTANNQNVRDTTCDTVGDPGAQPNPIPAHITHEQKTTTNYYQVDVRYDETKTPQLQTLSDCKAIKTQGQNIYQWKFSTRTQSGAVFSNIIFGSDMDYTASCNFDTQGETLLAKSSAVTITGDTLKTLTYTPENVKFEVRKKTDDTAITSSVALGTEIYLHIDLTTVTDGPTGIYAYSCKACDKSDCAAPTPAYVLTDANGCYAPNVHLGTSGTPAFTGTVANTIKTAAFMNWVFNGGFTTVYFICRVDYCYGTEIDKCKDMCTAAAGRRRRRRDAPLDEQVQGNHTVALRLTIDVGKGPQVKHYTPSILDGTMCTTRLVFIATSITVAGLLFVSIIVAAVMFVRVRRMRKSTK